MQTNIKINTHLPSSVYVGMYVLMYVCMHIHAYILHTSYYSMHFPLSIDTYGKLLKLWIILCIFSTPRDSCSANYYVLHVFAGEGEADGAAGENNLRWSSRPDWWSNVALYVQPETNDWLWLTPARGRPFWRVKKEKTAMRISLAERVMYGWSLLGVTGMLVILKICLTSDLQVSFMQGH